ncbi:PglZ domain-containing protein [Lentimicrobium sp.]|uniref:T9SS response regulator signal transducer PorX n=1 Tax=Lentimicrobium sp. TaxID=2034841 RepID=UPI0025D928F5|nr:PglZ domain-containing protein [Lentimicrobium sp.]MCO5255195.1 PglZ domain-containing protein [Lentimicrobium sp.]MCO5262120.1 PglZ domain-containing protein [Lentimicrobium sp.]HPF63384.1 PglZ domain-containing protein [Lentimicrobium sp.]HPJ62215.1 PglZ domain-containing protein [Lentimicrobium sp.]HPR26008.1 PglZ domain-containing protein [Lentimicrobium sp.]
MENVSILWADDEIDLLKPHIMFLRDKGYEVFTSNNGVEAIEILKTRPFDIVFLDEQMPGLSGIETLIRVKNLFPDLPVVMITKSEEETIMEDAIGSKISDYLIKPVNPKQILLSLKKNLENKKLISEKTTFSYQQQFRNIGMEISNRLTHEEWPEIYRKLVYWELELGQSNDSGIMDVLKMQKEEAGQVFSRFVENNYTDWVNGKNSDRPVMSHTLIRDKLIPLLDETSSLFFILIDNLRYDQWKILQPIISELYRVESDEIYYSILPTTTQYARNALFAGLLPTEIEKKYPRYWVNEDDEGTKNQFEGELLGEQLKRYGRDIKYSYHKILNLTAGRKLVETMPNLLGNKLNVIVYNFVDMLSHARTEMEVIRELADDEAAYRSITVSWFEHSPLFEIIRFLAEKKLPVVITTDHGSVKVDAPVKIVGDKATNTNLRYKTGRSLSYNRKEVFEVKNPADVFLPRTNVSSNYVFCRNTDFFAYPNNFNYYVNYYRNTFQHGGISMEEMMIPFVTLKAK